MEMLSNFSELAFRKMTVICLLISSSVGLPLKAIEWYKTLLAKLPFPVVSIAVPADAGVPPRPYSHV